MATHKTDLGTKWDVGVSINRTNPIPLDSTQNHSSLTTLQTYAKTGATSYVGQQVNVVDSNGNLVGAYIIKNTKGDLMELANTAILESLSGVFTFKGVAESINEAQTIITLSSATATKGSNTYTVKCQTIGYEYDMDIYYGWGATADSILFWTDTPTLTSTSTQYGVTTPTAVKKLVLNGEDYYIADRTVPAGDGLSQWENISGKVVYCNETTSKVYSEDQEDPEYELGVAEIVTYEAYDFAPLVASDKYTVSNIASADVATEGTTGHVYQIEENEYASNGTIWVKLGAPTENWIVL